MDKKEIKLLERNGWIIECESPFEIRHEDGSFATMFAAVTVLEELQREDNEANKTIKSLEELNNIQLTQLSLAEFNSNEYRMKILYDNQEKILKAIKIVGNNTILFDDD